MVKRKTKRQSSPSPLLLPQVIDSAGNFLNNVRKPFFVWGVLALGVIAFGIQVWTSKVGGLYDVLQQQNKLAQENNDLRKQQNDLLKHMSEQKCDLTNSK